MVYRLFNQSKICRRKTFIESKGPNVEQEYGTRQREIAEEFFIYTKEVPLNHPTIYDLIPLLGISFNHHHSTFKDTYGQIFIIYNLTRHLYH